MSLPVAAFALLMLVFPQQHASAQRRPGVSTNFYTTTGLLTADVEAGSLRSTTAFAEVPNFAASVVVTTALAKRTKHAWIAGARATVLSLGNDGGCYATSRDGVCQNLRFTEQVTLHAGGAFDIRSTVLRVMVGPTLYRVEGSGARVGTQLHLDLARPRLRGPTPTLFFARSFLGSERGEAVGISTLGAGFRWVRKT
jgi:hypothetical protein